MGFSYDDNMLQWEDGIEYLHNPETHCHICHKPFNIERSDRVRDHDNVTGNFRGPAHKWCKIRLRRICKIPMLFHNFREYESHFIAMAMQDFPVVDIQVIGQGREKYLTFPLESNWSSMTVASSWVQVWPHSPRT